MEPQRKRPVNAFNTLQFCRDAGWVRARNGQRKVCVQVLWAMLLGLLLLPLQASHMATIRSLVLLDTHLPSISCSITTTKDGRHQQSR